MTMTVNDYFYIYMAYKNFYTKPCVSTSPDTQSIHVGSHKLKLAKDIHTTKVQTAPPHQAPPESVAIHSSYKCVLLNKIKNK